jgi:hypothetical protein
MTFFKRSTMYNYTMGDSTFIDHPAGCILALPTPSTTVNWKTMLEANIRVRATETGPL